MPPSALNVSKNIKTSQTKEKDSLYKQSKNTWGDKSLMVQVSSQTHHISQGQHFKNAQLRRQKRKDMKQFKKFLHQYPKFPSKEEQEEEEIIKRQEKALVMLKKVCEVLKGHKITENCYDGGEDNKTSMNDNTTIGGMDQFQNGSSMFQHQKEFPYYTGQFMHSLCSKD